MKWVIIFGFTLLLLFNNLGTCQMNKKKQSHANRLIHETSPYLLQHAHNPVDWYPWSDKAFDKAKKENKPVLISIGYAACHWCHVMEKESFENEEIAALMNQYFVCIKVDREERPDVDQIYMEAVQSMTGHGGWPLNCFVLPDGRPFWGGTYFKPDQWKNVLIQIKDTFSKQPEKLEQIAQQLHEGLSGDELITLPEDSSTLQITDITDAYSNWKNYFDTQHGGNKRAHKFPLPSTYDFLLQYYYYTKAQSALDHALLSLDKMAQGGIYDHVGGGFARYSTDLHWKVPHFEKMLYDNAQLASLYAHAYQLTGKPLYKKVIEGTLQFVEEELMDKSGGFYSSLDADSEGMEGKFYTWKKQEIDSLLGEYKTLFYDVFNIKEKGNWDGTNILHITQKKAFLMEKFSLNEEELDTKIVSAINILKKARGKRIHPRLDDKILTSWNALTLIGYIDAYNALGNEQFLKTAIRNADFILKNQVREGGRLWRTHKNGISKINAFLDDYSFTIQAFIKLYQATFDERWLLQSQKLTDYVLAHFNDENSALFFYTSDEDPDLIARKKELSDNVIPASNSSLANGLFTLGILLGENNYSDLSHSMLQSMQTTMTRNIADYSNWGMLALSEIHAPYELVIAGKDALEERKNAAKKYLPNIMLAGSTGNKSPLYLLKNRYVKGETFFYLCQNRSCRFPVRSFDEVLKQME